MKAPVCRCSLWPWGCRLSCAMIFENNRGGFFSCVCAKSEVIHSYFNEMRAFAQEFKEFLGGPIAVSV